MEIWKDVKDYEGYYEVSNTGKVRSLPRATTRGKILKTSIIMGYECVGVWKDGVGKMVKVHRLMAQAFISNPANLPQINHLDGNKLNNVLENLEWVSVRENMTHRELNRKNKTSKFSGVSSSEYKGRITWIAYSWFEGKRHYLGSFMTEEEASSVYTDFVNTNKIQNKYALTA